MKIAVMGSTGAGVMSLLATSLSRMLTDLKVDHAVFPHGMKMLLHYSGLRKWIKKAAFRAYMTQLRDCDAIVIVQCLRDAFWSSMQIEALRKIWPEKPILLYDAAYFPTLGLWGPWLEPAGPGLWGSGKEKYFGLGRYDWYLCISSANRNSMPSGAQPCTRIGLSLDRSALFPEQRGEFRALVDFKREKFMAVRQIQLEALRKTETEYIELDGRYSVDEIRALYRKCSIYFIAHMESFGMPICELQACGCRVMTPVADWCDGHRLLDERSGVRNGLPPNFCVYDNDPDKLSAQIEEIKRDSDPAAVLASFRQYHPHFIDGDADALQSVIDRIGRGEVSAKSHLEYGPLMEQVAPRRPDSVSC